MIDFSELDAAVLNAFGESVMFTVPAGSVFLPAIYDVDQDVGNVADLPVNGDVKTLAMLRSDIEAHGITIRGKVQVRDDEYHIVDIAHDAAGISTLQIRRYG